MDAGIDVPVKVVTEARPFAPGRSPKQTLSADAPVVRGPQAHVPKAHLAGESETESVPPPTPHVPVPTKLSRSIHPCSPCLFLAEAVLTEGKLEELEKSLHQDLENSTANLRSVRKALQVQHAATTRPPF